MEIWRTQDGSEIGIRAATWHLNPRITFESLAPELARNRILFLRNYASIVDSRSEGAIKDSQLILAYANTQRNHPWDPARDCFHLWFRGQPATRYFIHFDLSKSRDATGVAMVHRDRHDTGAIVVDFMVRIEVPFGRDVDYSWLREKFVYDISSRGFHVQRVSFDQFQSAESEQVLKEKGYETSYVSVDRTLKGYDTLIELMLTRRLDYYPYPPFILEMEELQLVDGRKFDHPRKSRDGKPGHKDCADAVAGAILNAIDYEAEHPLPQPGTLKVMANPKLHQKAPWEDRSLF